MPLAIPRATTVLRRPDMAGKLVSDSITLDRAARWRRRVALQTDRGLDVLLDLAEATYLADGDGLLLDDMRVVKVIAQKEPLLEIHAASAADLARMAWHIGNRHTPCEVTSNALYIQPDHVLAEMIVGLGGHVHVVERAFEPEGGAYGHKGALAEGHHGHDHGHAPSHDHGRGSDTHAHPHSTKDTS